MLSLSKTNDVASREDAGVVIHLRDETNEKMYVTIEGNETPQPVTMRVAGSYSSTYRRAQEANRDRMIKRRNQLDGDELTASGLDLQASCVLGWTNLVVDGEPFKFTKANAVALLDAAPWIREQVEAAINNHAAFFKPA